MTDSIFDDGTSEEGFDPKKAAKAKRTPAQMAALKKAQEARKAKAAAKRRDKISSAKNSGDQTVHPAAHEAVHDENTESLTADMYDIDAENEVTEWRRPSNLDAPPARPGYVNRWIRIRFSDGRDNARLRKAMHEGWRPVRASASEVQGHSLPSIQHDQLGDGDYIGAEDLILMEMPERVHAQRQEFYRQKKQRMTGSTERQVRGVHDPSHEGFGAIQVKNTSKVRRTG